MGLGAEAYDIDTEVIAWRSKIVRSHKKREEMNGESFAEIEYGEWGGSMERLWINRCSRGSVECCK